MRKVILLTIALPLLSILAYGEIAITSQYNSFEAVVISSILSRDTANYDIELYEDPSYESEIIGNIKRGEKFTVVDAISIFTYVESDDPVVADYYTYYYDWYKFMTDTIEGWQRYNWVNSIFVRFDETYSSLREAPYYNAPVVKKTMDRYDGYWVINPDIPAGQLYRLLGYFRGWYCVGDTKGGGWIPANSECVRLFGPLDKEVVPDLETESLLFLVPYTDYVDRIYYVEDSMAGYEYLDVYAPEVIIYTDDGAFPGSLVTEFWSGIGHTGLNYYEFVLDAPVLFTDIRKISLTSLHRLDESGRRSVVVSDWYDEMGQ